MLDGLASNIADVIAEGAKTFDIDPAPAPIYANALLGVGAHVGRWWGEHPEVSLDEVTARTTELLWSGFAGIANLTGND